jgi:RimJ/RimL family protein N-acetyltransferase
MHDDRVVIRGPRVRLRPFRPDELEAWLAARMASADDPTVSPAGPPDPERLRERVGRSGTVTNGWLDLAIEVDGRLAGEIGTYPVPGRPPVPGAFFLGIGLFDTEDRGRGLGTEALELLCGWLFTEADAERIDSSTAVTNAAMRRVFEKIGFEPGPTESRWDVEWATYSMTRDAWDRR